MLGPSSLVSLGLALGVATAAPLTTTNERRQDAPAANPVYPTFVDSKGFRLVANVTDQSADLSPSVNGMLLSGIHTGAGLSLAVVTESTENQRIFYQNGTAEDVHNRAGTLLTDSGSSFAWGLVVEKVSGDDDESSSESSVSINGGGGTEHVQLSTSPEPISYVVKDAQGTFAVCKRAVPYYQNQEYPVVLFFESSFNSGSAQYESTVPDGCAPIKLLPEAADLPDTGVNHDNAQVSRTYQDVKGLDWSKYASS